MTAMSPEELQEVIRLHGLWLRGDPAGKRANLSGANMARANLSGADMARAYMARANLSGADMTGANMAGTNLLGANLTGAYMKGANLTGAYMKGADLAKTDMTGADLTRANLTRADLTRAHMTRADLTGTTMTEAIGNMREVKSAHFDNWPLVWTRNPAGITTLCIGCQSHDLEEWRDADPDWIEAMDPDATEWWAKYGAIALAMVDASPAVMWGRR